MQNLRALPLSTCGPGHCESSAPTPLQGPRDSQRTDRTEGRRHGAASLVISDPTSSAPRKANRILEQKRRQVGRKVVNGTWLRGGKPHLQVRKLDSTIKFTPSCSGGGVELGFELR